MSNIKQPEHIHENEFAQNFRSKKSHVSMSKTSREMLFRFLQDNVFLFKMVDQYIDFGIGGN